MDGVVTGERWQRMNEIVEWCWFAHIVRGVTSKKETLPLLMGERW